MKVDKDVLVIHNWCLFCGCVIGQIYNDERSWKKEYQMTSTIVDIDTNEGTLQTMNTFYHLGKEYAKKE